MQKRLQLLIGFFSLVLILGFILSYSQKKTNQEKSIEEQREMLVKHLQKSPFKETLSWDKKTRKLNGLPPNKYFEQLWELSLNPATGRLDDGALTLLREELIQNRTLNRNPGETGNAWEERGPNDIGGRTRVILFDPNDATNNTVYAGGVSGGLWVNIDITNSASSWTRIENLPGNLSVTSITVDPRNSNIWYVGTGEQYTAGDVVGNGVYVTTDGGTSWSAINIIPADAGDINFNASNLFLSGIYYVNDIIAWDNGTSTELFVAVGAHAYGDASSPANWLGIQSSGIYRSTDGGSSWNRIESSNMDYVVGSNTYYYIPNDFEVSADNTLWMSTINSPFSQGGGRIYSSTDGATWTEATASPLSDSNRVEIEVSTTNPNKIYALTQGVSSPVHIYVTTDGFATTPSTLALPNDVDLGIPANDFARGQSFYNLMIEADPNNDNIVYVGGIDLFRSTNSGSSWSQISKWSNNNNLAGLNSSLVHADHHAMVFRPGNPNQAIFGTDGGVYYASSLSTAQNTDVIGARNNNYNVTQHVKAGIGPNGFGDLLGIFTAGSQDNGSQAFRDGNAAPGINGSEELSDGDGFYTFVDKDGQYMIATFVYNIIYRFNLPWNGLGRRQGGATTLSNDQSRGDFVNQMDYDSNANRLLTNNSNNIQNAIKSINVASNSNGSLTNGLLTAEPSAFRASPFENNAWYVGLKNGELIKLTGVTNNSATWSGITTPFVGSVSSVRFGAALNDLIVTIHNYGVTSVWYSSNAGTSWVSKEGDLPNIPVRDFLLNPLNTNEAIIATQLGVWSTPNFNDINPVWIQSYNGMSDVSVTSFDYWAKNGNDNDNIVIASTYGRGVFTGSFNAETTLIYSNSVWTPNAPSNLTGANNALVLDGTYTISSDIVINNITIANNATMVLEKASSLTVNSDLENKGNIILESDSNEYSSLIVNGIVIGNVDYNRHVNTTAATSGNDLISPPVSGQIFIDFIAANSNIVSNGTNTLYLFGPFDKITNTYILYSNTETSTLNAGTGYRAASTNASTFTFSGTVNTGNMNIPIVVSGPNFPEWNLIGNPYPSYIRLDDFLTANSSQLAAPSVGVYGYDGNASDGWTIWNQAYSDLNPNAIITPGQGFLVASASGGGTISFTPSMRIIGNDDDFILGREANSGNISYLKLEMNNSSELYKTEFYFSDNASLGLDPGYDAGSFGGVAPAFGIYSHLVQDSDGRDMAIQAINNNDINTTTIIPLGINANQGEQLTISIVNSTLLQDVNIYLEDNLTNTFTLLNDSDYTFTPNTDLNGIGRFFLRFEPETLSITENPINSLQIYNTNNPKLLFVNGRLNENTALSFYDIQGRLVLSKTLNINLTSNKVSLNTIASGIYIVKLKNNTQSISRKIVIH